MTRDPEPLRPSFGPTKSKVLTLVSVIFNEGMRREVEGSKPMSEADVAPALQETADTPALVSWY